MLSKPRDPCDLSAYVLMGYYTTTGHCTEVMMCAVASQITNLMIVYSTVYWRADRRKHQNSASLVFVRGIHRWPMNSPHKLPVTRKMFTPVTSSRQIVWLPSASEITVTKMVVAGIKSTQYTSFCISMTKQRHLQLTLQYCVTGPSYHRSSVNFCMS